MKLIKTKFDPKSIRILAVVLLLYSVVISATPLLAQSQTTTSPPDSVRLNETPEAVPGFRIEKVPVAGGSEIITIFSKHSFAHPSWQGPATEIPLVSILRDTLGDDILENDRLRYVWLLTYTEASLSQKLSASIPFLYSRTTNNRNVGTAPPPPVVDVQSPNSAVWNKIFWILFKRLVLAEFGLGLRAPTSQYRQNADEYRRSAVAGALTVLSLYQEVEGEEILSDSELRDVQARLHLSDKTFGWHMQSENLDRVYEKELTKTRDFRGHNWELLRQYAEAQGLYFEPLEMPGGDARHAIVWTTAEDLQLNKGKNFDRRFLNIKNPWTDKKLAGWNGFSQVRWYDADDRVVEAGTPGAKSRTMIPLALYGLDNPKIPLLLVDFRDNGNIKRREMSRRVLNDLTGGVLSLSRFGGFPFFVGRLLFDFAVGRRGMDLAQASRMRSYSQLKLLLSLDASLDPEFRNDISERIESATLNPLQNDADVEARLARSQYANLMAYAKRPDGLPKKIFDDRRQEMVRLRHGRKGRIMFGMARVFSFGLYTHRESSTPELSAQMDIRRQLDFHERNLIEAAFALAKPEIDGNITELKRSLAFVSENGAAARGKTARALAKIFAVTGDDEMKTLSLAGLYRINSSPAKKELLAIHRNMQIPERWRLLCGRYLKLALEEGQTISARDAEEIAAIGAN